MGKVRYLQPLHAALLEHGTAQADLFDGTDPRILDLATKFLGNERVDPVYAAPRPLSHGPATPSNPSPAGLATPQRLCHAHRSPTRDPRRPLPRRTYGPKARLILLYLMTEAVKTRSRQIELGRSMRAWLGAMGVPIGGTNYRAVAEQAARIEHAILRFEVNTDSGEASLQDSIIRGSFRPFDATSSEHTVELSEGFYRAITARPVPIIKSALRLLADTCMPLDLYLWLSYRLHALERPTPLTWSALHRQFGAGTKLLKHFRPRAVRDLKVALAVYPEAQVTVSEAGIVLHPSPPPVAPRPTLVRKPET